MYAGPFFLLVTIFFYGLCHLVASRTTPRTNELYFHKIHFSCSYEDIIRAIGSWVYRYDNIRFFKNDKKEIIIESKANWSSFGGFYYLRFSEQEGKPLVLIGAKPKLVADSREQARFIESFMHHVCKENPGTEAKAHRPETD